MPNGGSGWPSLSTCHCWQSNWYVCVCVCVCVCECVRGQRVLGVHDDKCALIIIFMGGVHYIEVVRSSVHIDLMSLASSTLHQALLDFTSEPP